MSHAKRQAIEVELDYPLAILRLNRPERLNALNKEIMNETSDALNGLEADDQVRVVILCGAGRAFSSGFDMAEGDEETTHTVVEWREHLKPAARFAQRLWNYPKPIIAAVHGYCLGGACGLAMLCDMTIASEDCKFGEPEIRSGVGSANIVMPWIVPIKIAKELLYTGKMISAQRAYEIGMVNEVVPSKQLEKRTRYHALLISKMSPIAVQLMKQAVNRTYEMMGMQSALAHSFDLVAILDGSETVEKQQFEKIRQAQGMKAALDWRKSQFAEVEQIG